MVGDPETLRPFLARKRSEVQPEEVGLPARQRGGRGRPVIGLSQSDMDALMNRAMGTFQKFECGALKATRPDYLQDVARILRFTEQDWQTLWAYLYGQRPPHTLDPDAGQIIAHGWGEFIDGISHAAYVTDQAWEILEWNEAFAQLFAGRNVPTNTMEWMLLSDSGRSQLIDWRTSWAPLVVPQLRGAVKTYPHNEKLRELEDRVRRDPVTGPMYDEITDAYAQPDGDIRRIYHYGFMTRGWVTIRSAEPGGSPGARFMGLVFKPEPPRDARNQRSSGSSR